MAIAPLLRNLAPPLLCAWLSSCTSDASGLAVAAGAPTVSGGTAGASSAPAASGSGGAAGLGQAGAHVAAGAAGLTNGGSGGTGNSSGGNGSAAGAGAASAGGSAPTLPADPPPSAFGNLDLHAQKLGFYMVPDLDAAYRSAAAAPQGASGKWCAWTKTQASLYRLSQLLPDAWIRWDNETGHNTSSTDNVSTFVTCAENANVGMIVSADASDGYDNFWANQYVTGVAAPNRSLIDIANGPYLSFAHTLLR